MRAAWPIVLVGVLVLPLAFAENVVHNPATGVPDQDVIVAVIDTGIDPNHPEFSAGQIVAWWDFSLSAATGVWMTGVTPNDPHGHGTGTASLVGGATVGAYPGVKLAIAKVGDSSGDITGDVSNAIRWAVDVVGADVISISIGPVAPIPGHMSDEDDAARYATESGALVVASAGNGVLGAAPRYPGEFHPPSSDPSALMVGAVGHNGRYNYFDTLVWSFYSNLDPDVAAWGTFACMAKGAGTTMAASAGSCKGNDARYGESSGTSFSTPRVAGWGAKVMQAAMDANQDASPARVKSLLLGTATDTTLPYAIEGRGFVNGFTPANSAGCVGCNFVGVPNTVANAVALAQSGGAPPAPGLEAGTAAAASGQLRYATSDTDRSLLWIGTPHASNGERVLAASAIAVRDAETWAIPLARGDRIGIFVNASQGAPFLNDADMVLYPPSAAPTGDPVVYSLEAAHGESHRVTDNGQTRERIELVARESGTHLLVVYATSAKHTGMAYSLVVKVNGATVSPAYLGDETHVAFQMA